jgi:hypothetical protein
MRILSSPFRYIYWLYAAMVLLGLAGVVHAGEVPVSDENDALAVAMFSDSDDSIAQAAPGVTSDVAPGAKTSKAPGPAVSPKTPSKPKTSPPKPPVRRPVEEPLRPAEEPSLSTANQLSPNLLASIYGGNAPAAERLAGTPNMFGDFFNNMGGGVLVAPGYADLPLAAASRRVKIAENDNALPQDRVFFLYNHFENALQMSSAPFGRVPSTERSFSVDRYTFGLEKRFLNDCWSVELRMPLAGRTEFLTPAFGVSGGSTGNLAVIVKRAVYESDITAVSVGLGIDTPTGSDVQGYASFNTLRTNYFTVQNNAVHLLPYMGFVSAPTCRFFYQGFAQVDVPANGNRIDYLASRGASITNSSTYGVLNEQTLLYLDLSGGCWLYRNPCARGLTGLASVLEFHYTTTLQDTDVIQGTAFPTPFPITFENFSNRVDIVNLTVGLHAEFVNNLICRVGGVFPLSSGDNRSFDSEVQAQLEWRF